jgi:uncharacterized protein involved in response to NO
MPLQGAPLLVLGVVWFAGRIAVAFSAKTGWLAAAIIDVGFLALVLAAVTREIIKGKNWRNLRVIVPVLVLALADAGFHLECHASGVADHSVRTGIAAVLILLMLIAGRIIPSFSRNWLARENPGRLPTPFGKFDAFALLISTAALCVWIIEPDGSPTGMALFLAGILQALRLARWAGDRTISERLVLILHIAYAFVPLGFILMGLAAVRAILPSAGLHAWLAGAVGTMTLAVMTRASLSHTGHGLVAGTGTQTIYAAVCSPR